MLNRILLTALLLALAVIGALAVAGATGEEPAVTEETELAPEEKLVVLWTSGDVEVAEKMLFMYVGNAPRYGWWQDITLVVWGPSAQLLAGNPDLQAAVAAMQEAGVTLEACKACSDLYGVSDQLAACGIDVKYMGDALTAYIKEGRHVLTI